MRTDSTMNMDRERTVIEPWGAPAIMHAVRLLEAGALVAFPTETVYGLGADARNMDAVHALFRAKGRPLGHPVIVHIAHRQEMDVWCESVPPLARKLATAFWPGPLTLILPRASHVADVLTGGQASVGLRVPSHPAAQALLRAFGGGIAAPSANRFGRISPTTAAHVAEDLGTRVPLIIDGGACPVGIESTIVAFVDGVPVLLRPGGISVQALTAALGRAPVAPGQETPRASGTLASHYAPRTPASLVDAKALRVAIASDGSRTIAVLARSVARPATFGGTWIDARPNPEAYAHALYANLRTLDHSGATTILIEAPPRDPHWLAVRDRLERATHATPFDSADEID